MRLLLILVVGLFVLGACVPNKRIVYLQHTTEPKPGEVKNTDSLKRSYTTHFSDYLLKPRDVISLNIASITPQEFDFVKKYEEQLGLIRRLNQYDQVSKTGGQRMGMGIGGQGDAGISPIALDRLQSGFVLDEDGILELPYLGRVVLKDLTLPQAEALIKEKLKGYFETPVIRIQLLSFHFTILGEVNKEGRYTTFDPNATIIDALAMAENLNDYADRSKIKVVRMEGQIARVFYVNALSEDLLSQPAYFLKPDDVIIVPPLKARSLRKYGLPNYAAALSLITSSLTLLLLIVSINNNK